MVAPRGLDGEIKFHQFFDGWQDTGLVAFLHRYKNCARQWNAHAGPQLAFREGHVEGLVEAHDFASRTHFRPEQNIDTGEAVEGEHSFFHRHMIELLRLQFEIRNLLARHHPRRDLGHRFANHLGNEGHGARGAWIDFEDIDNIILHRELHIHQAHDLEGEGELAGLRLQFRNHLRLQGVGRKRAGRVAGVDARLFNVFHDARHKDILAIGNHIHIHFRGVGEIGVDQHR